MTRVLVRKVRPLLTPWNFRCVEIRKTDLIVVRSEYWPPPRIELVKLAAVFRLC
jgi:hypothetical protein